MRGVLHFSVDYAAIYNQPAGTPGAFEEAGIDVHDVTGMPSFSMAREPPNIDILVVTNKTERDPVNGLIDTLVGRKTDISTTPVNKTALLDLGPERGQLYRQRRRLCCLAGYGERLQKATETYHLCLMHYFSTGLIWKIRIIPPHVTRDLITSSIAW